MSFFDKEETINVLSKLKDSGINFSITDLKWLNGGLYFLDWKESYPNLDLARASYEFQDKEVRLFEFPAFFEGKIESKIFFHFQRKSKNLRDHMPKNRQGKNLISEHEKRQSNSG